MQCWVAVQTREGVCGEGGRGLVLLEDMATLEGEVGEARWWYRKGGGWGCLNV
jgi:hypothetical protein